MGSGTGFGSSPRRASVLAGLTLFRSAILSALGFAGEKRMNRYCGDGTVRHNIAL